MVKISVQQATCIRCKKCVKVCPALIFVAHEQEGEIGTSNSHTCIRCGHCAAVCPTASVVHSDFPPHKVHSINSAQLPSPEQVMLLCKSRRSARVFTREMVPAEQLGLIVEAAHRAPTGSNLQEVSFTLVTDPEKVKLVSQFTLDTFVEMRKKLLNPLLKPILKAIKPQYYRYVPLINRMQREMETGNDMILRNGTSILLIHAPKSASMGAIDSNLAYQNGSLMAESLGVGQFYGGFILNAIGQKRGKLEEQLGIKGAIHAVMVLGMPQFRFPNYIDKKEAMVTRL